MKKTIFTQKLTFHNLFTGRIIYKLHVDIFGFAFRIPFWAEKAKKGNEIL